MPSYFKRTDDIVLFIDISKLVSSSIKEITKKKINATTLNISFRHGHKIENCVKHTTKWIVLIKINKSQSHINTTTTTNKKMPSIRLEGNYFNMYIMIWLHCIKQMNAGAQTIASERSGSERRTKKKRWFSLPIVSDCSGWFGNVFFLCSFF